MVGRREMARAPTAPLKEGKNEKKRKERELLRPKVIESGKTLPA
jgi:hypothetical protein